MTESEWLDNLCSKNRYSNGELIGDGKYVCLSPFLFTIAIIVGTVGNDDAYEDRWCFEPYLALPALKEWKKRNFEGEPIGYNRRV
jgi:hypothetical protein